MIAILGAGGHGQDIAATIARHRFYDDDPDLGHRPLCECVGQFIIGVNDGRTRRNIAERLRRLGVSSVGSWSHPRANVGPDVVTGKHTHINGGAFVTRARLGDYVTVGPNATICGDVTIGNLASIGAGAVVCEFCVIGEGATIGAGAVVTPHTIVPAGETWVGVPARSTTCRGLYKTSLTPSDATDPADIIGSVR